MPGILTFLIIVLIIYLGFLILESILCHSCTFDYYFGVPGSGKTTFAAWITKKQLKRKCRVHSNVAIKGAYKVDKSDIGKYDISNTHLILDEASISMNNRNYKDNFTDDQIKWFKLHRHYKVNISVFSQSHEDVDVTLRRLSTRYFLLHKSCIPFFITRRHIKRFITIDKEKQQIIDGYKFKFLGRRLIFSPAMWKMFDSYEAPELPSKDFEVY